MISLKLLKWDTSVTQRKIRNESEKPLRSGKDVWKEKKEKIKKSERRALQELRIKKEKKLVCLWRR